MPPPRKYSYDRAAGRYRASSGRFLPSSAIRQQIDGALVQAQRRVVDLARQLQRREINLATWELATRGAVKDVHLYSYAAAKGGWANMAPADYLAVGRAVKAQYGYLSRWAAQLANGTALLDGRLLSRAALYAQSGRQTYETAAGAELARRGFDEAMNEIHASESCEGAGSCREISRRGWVRVEDYLVPGTRLCGPNCRCTTQRRNSVTGEIAA